MSSSLTFNDTMNSSIQPSPSSRDPPADETHQPPTPTAPSAPPNKKDHVLEDAPIDWRVLADRVLHFLSTATNETLGACLVGLGAGTYLILGRVGLILIGVVGGVVLHATWEGHAHANRGDGKGQALESRRREAGIDVAHRILDWREKEAKGKDAQPDEADTDLSVKLYSGQKVDFSDFRPETAAALTELTEAVIRDYVKYAATVLPMYHSNTVQMVVPPNHTQRDHFPRVVSPDSCGIPNIYLCPPFT